MSALVLRAAPLATLLGVLAVPAAGQLCPGDSKDNYSITNVDTQNRTRVQIWSRTKLLHGPSHPGCAGIVSVSSWLWLQTGTVCSTGLMRNASATATSSNANHEKTAQKWCTVALCHDQYHTRGYHYFNSQDLGDTFGPNAIAGNCTGGTCSPCMPGYAEGGSCESSQQDECGCCPAPTPLVVDRSGDGLRFSSAEDGALLDINGYRSMFWMGWPTSADDAWLVLDRNGNGLVDNGSELFGNTRRLATGRNAAHGYEVLAELDENGDGVVDASDPAFVKLQLWGDANRNGISEPNELTFLKSAGIERLAVDFRESEKRDEWGNRFRLLAVDGSSIDAYPVWRLPDSKLSGGR